MPLFFQLPLNQDTRLAVWHITEDETFFRNHAVPQREVSHPHKRLQHLAGRYLLRHLFPDFPTALIRIADTRKPFLEDEAYHFSISHCSNYAAAVVSRSRRVGVDIEVITEKAARIRHKFASEEEWGLIKREVLLAHNKQEYARGEDSSGTQKALVIQTPVTDVDRCASDAFCATLIWSCKEAVFKWYGAGEVDFREHIQIKQCYATTINGVALQVVFQKEEPEMLVVHSQLLAGLWLSYVMG